KLNERQREILFRAIKDPDTVFTVKGHMRMTDVVYETARKDLQDLVEAGFLEMKAQQKEYYFIPVAGLTSKIKIGLRT
ncbi:MAG TPA: Fic family protein, partial [Candidatus Omnitrophota bacterium]|nr:Fic family protein [Candidatus Omnitrophota bacterium]